MAKRSKRSSHKKHHVNKLLTRINQRTILVGIFLIALAGVGFLVISSAATTPSATGECGRKLQNYTHQVPFGNAVWNQPVCNLPRYARSAEFANKFFNWSALNEGTGNTGNFQKLRLNLGFGLDIRNSFSHPIYYAKDATVNVQIQASVLPSNLDGNKWEGSSDYDRQKYLPDRYIPWNPSWESAQGGDNSIIILDEQQGIIYEIYGYKKDLEAYTQCGPLFRERICTYHVEIGRNEVTGEVIDYRTYEGPLKQRGSGLSLYAGLLTADDVASGEIRHVLSVAVPNTAKKPACTSQQLGTSAESNTCGTALAPATKFEYVTIDHGITDQDPWKAIYDNAKSIPEGTRFAIDITDQEIENWISLQSRFNGQTAKAQSARVIAKALRDYGFMIVDTAGTPSIQNTGILNPTEKTKWQNLGFNSLDDRDILDGLLTKERIYTVNPPTVTCQDGTQSKNYCLWTSATYDTEQTPPPPVIGDFDGNGTVSLPDLAKLLSNYGKSVGKYTNGDCDGNGFVSLPDLAILLSNFGKQ